MLLIASESFKNSSTTTDVARELSLVPGYFASQETLLALLAGRTRRIVLLTEQDISRAVLDALSAGSGPNRFGIIVAVDRDAIRSSDKVGLLEAIGKLDNVEWIEPEVDFEWLSSAARQCRRHMLRLSRGDLEEAIEERQLFLQYQPKVQRSDGTDWETREVEALIRWHHPVDGIVAPTEFLPEAEAFDLIGTISEYVLAETARQLKSWEERGLDLTACVNLASSLLADQSIAERYAGIVDEASLECSRFTFEITEHDLGNRDAPHLKTLDALREKGFRICLDDFRVAATSLGAFESLPFDEIKIQATSLRRAQGNPVKLQVLAAVAGLAKSLGVAVCVAGIEDLETVEYLKMLECDKMQGFLISEAVMPNIIRRVYSAAVEDVA